MNKKKFRSTITKGSLAALLLSSSFAPIVAEAQSNKNNSLPIAVATVSSIDVMPNEYIVSFKQGVSIAEMKSSLANYNLVSEHFDFNLATVKLTKAQFNKLKTDLNIEILEPNVIIESNSTKEIVKYEYAHDKTNVRTAWSQNLKGTGVTIAVLDTGIAPHHDLKITGGVSMVDYTTSYFDDKGHGTHVAGVIGALDNGIGTTGVASEANIYSVKVLQDTGEGKLIDILAGLDWAINKGVDIINISIGISQNSLALKKRIDEAEAKGIIVVASSGNTGEGSTNYPALYDNVVAVSATNKHNELASFSSYGSNVKIAAPGEAIPSTHLNGDYAMYSGTSQAAPYVAGVLALYKQAYPGKSSKELIELLYQNALDLGVPGKDNSYGYGLVQFPTGAIIEEPKTDEPTIEEPTTPIPQEPIETAPKTVIHLDEIRNRIYWDEFADASSYRIVIEQQQADGSYEMYKTDRFVKKGEFPLSPLKRGFNYRITVMPRSDNKVADESQAISTYVTIGSKGHVEQSPVIQKPVEQPPVIQKPVEQPPVIQKPVEQPPVIEKPVEQPPVIEKPVEQPPVFEKPVEQPPVFEKPVEQPPVFEKPVEQDGLSITVSKQLKWTKITKAIRYRVEMKQKNSEGTYEKFSSPRNVRVTQFDLGILGKDHEYELTIVPFIGNSLDYNQAIKVYVNTSNYEFKAI